MPADQQSSSTQKSSRPAAPSGSRRGQAEVAANNSRQAPLPDPFQFSVYLRRLATGAKR